MYKLIITLLFTLIMALSVMAADTTKAEDKKEMSEETKKATDTTMAEDEPAMMKTESGVRYQDLVIGKGNTAAIGSKVTCHYTLWLADSTGLVKGKRLQSSKDGGQPFDCTLGTNLIKGWSDGSVGMQEGGVRRLYIPWELGYGAKGMGQMIPPMSNLIFEIEYVKAR